MFGCLSKTGRIAFLIMAVFFIIVLFALLVGMFIVV